MKQSSKERLATLLMDELLERLATRESIRAMLGDMTTLPIDDVVDHILEDFEKAVEEFHRKHFAAAEETPGKRVEENVAAEVRDAVTAEPVAAVPPVEVDTQHAGEDGGMPPPVHMAPGENDTPADPADVQTAPPEPLPEPVQEPATAGDTPVDVQTVPPEPPPEPIEEPAAAVEPQVPETQATAPTVQLDPIRLEFPKINLRIDLPEVRPPTLKQERTGPAKQSGRSKAKEGARERAEDQQKELRRLEELAKQIESEYEARRKTIPVPAQSPGVQAEQPSAEPQLAPAEFADTGDANEQAEEIIDVEPVGSGKHIAHARYTFADDEHVYVHAVSRIPPGEEASPDPFMLEEKGIDGKGFAFALDYAGMRIYLSKINPTEVNISRSMVLLLNKQESLQMQGLHESTLNDLRAHGILLPMEFGTVARGKDYLFRLIDRNQEDLEEALDELEKTTWWTVTASVLDSTIASIVGTDVQHVGRERSRDRASYMSIPSGKKFEIKVLERILQREKKIAEAIHAELSKVVERSDIETIIGLGSGSSEDWKVILKASYEVPREDLARFNRTVTDLQYHHLQYDLMLALTGDKDWLTLRKK